MKKTTYITPAAKTVIISVKNALANSPYGQTGQAGPTIGEDIIDDW